MTLRDYFAAKAMASMLAERCFPYDGEMPRIAYKIADEMLRARETAPVAVEKECPVSRIAQAHRFLEWNRRQAKPPVEIGMEYHVFEVAAALATGVESALPLVEPDAKELNQRE